MKRSSHLLTFLALAYMIYVKICLLILMNKLPPPIFLGYVRMY